MPLLSVATTAYNEAQNLPLLYERLVKALDGAGIPWELIVVDDHSRDATFAVISKLAAADRRVRGVRLSRNTGSHLAMMCALEKCSGDCVAQIAADLQHPPELLPELWKMWGQGAQVVWAARRSGESGVFAPLYYFLMRHVVGMKELPAEGADFCVLDRCVVRALADCGERNTSILALIAWMGFRQATTYYDRQPRVHGRSGWTLEKKIKLVADSITSFTCLPIRLISFTGIAVALAGLAAAGLGPPLMAAILLIGGVQMIMLGVLGEYIWRALDEARRRPRYFIEAATPPAGAECKSAGNTY